MGALAYFLFDQRVETPTVLRLASTDAASQTAAIARVAASDLLVAAYFGSLLVFVYFAPLLIRRAIVRWKLDRSESSLALALRFNGAPWYYLLTGADFPAGQEPDLISVSAIVDTGEVPMLYTGFLQDFFVSPEGELDRMVLSGVTRRPLSSDREDPNDAAPHRFYPVDGDYFVLRYSESITLNIKYISLSEVAADSNEASA